MAAMPGFNFEIIFLHKTAFVHAVGKESKFRSCDNKLVTDLFLTRVNQTVIISAVILEFLRYQ